MEEEKNRLEQKSKGDLKELKEQWGANKEKIVLAKDKKEFLQHQKANLEIDLSVINKDIEDLTAFINSNPTGVNGRKAVEGHYEELQQLQKRKNENTGDTKKNELLAKENEKLMDKWELLSTELEDKINLIETPLIELQNKINEWVKKKVGLIEDRLNEIIRQATGKKETE